MSNNLRDLFPEGISDETAYHIGNFLYELAQAFESAHFGQIRRYTKSMTDMGHKMMDQNIDQGMNAKKRPSDPAF